MSKIIGSNWWDTGPLNDPLEVFCPIIRHRLTRLRQILDFEFEEVDVTFRPHIVLAKGVRSVPLIEANGRFLIGNATSEQLASFLKEATESQQTTG